MTEPYEGYAIVELMGHRRLAGKVSQAEQYGVAMLRLDVPREDGTESTHFFGGTSLYGVHPTSEEVAKRVAESCDPAPVQRWELPALPEPKRDAFTEDVLNERERDRTGSPSEYDDDLCVDCAMLEGDCVCGEDDYDDQQETGPPTGEPSAGQIIPDTPPEIAAWPSQGIMPPTGEPPDVEAETSTEPCAICKPGHLCTEHEPF